MIRTMLAFAALALLAAPAAAEERRYSVTDFDRLTVEGPYIVNLVVGRTTSATASGSREALDRVSVDSQGRSLRIRRNRNSWGGGTPGADVGAVTITINTRSLRSARLIGPARLQVEGAEGLNVEFIVEGSGSLRASGVEADNLSLALNGSGRLEIAGTARRLNASLLGTGDVEATNLRAREAAVTTTTLGAVTLTVDGPVTVTAGGLGAVTILGRAVCTLRGAGASQVRCSNQRQDR